MSEYIDRESIRKVLMDVCSDENCPMFIAATIDQVIDYEPAADVAPVVHGEWITIDGISRCSECGYIPAYDSAIDDLFYSPYCPNCGAKMDGGDNIMNTNPECFTPEGNNPYPLCTGKDMPECENCQLRAGWNGGDTDEDEG